MYFIPPAPNDQYFEHYEWNEVFSKEECELLLKLKESGYIPDQQTLYPSNLKNDTARLIDANPDTEWVFKKLTDLMMEANQFWKIDVYSIGEPIQFIDYPVGKEYFYHIDNSPGGGSVRKITMVTQLSENYEGGEFAFLYRQKKMRLGDVIAFPSWQPHRVMPITKGVRTSMAAWFHGPTWR